jgi:3-hydroxybutyryl-CoA dehydratase
MLKEKLPEWYDEGYVRQGETPTWDDLKVGETFEIRPFLLTEERIKKFAIGTQDEHPFYMDEEAAKKSKYGGLIAPPTVVVAILYASVPPEHHIKTEGALNPKQKLEFGVPARPGDTIYGKCTITDKYIKRNKKYLEGFNLVTNQNGEMICQWTSYGLLPK